MKPVECLGTATAPDGTVLTLYRHDGAYSIRVGGVELMSTRRNRSEGRLAEVACGPLAHTVGARVLIGGLGLGFTLRAALALLPADAEVVVAELVAGVIDWNRTPEYGLAAAALDDPRVAVRHADVADVLRADRGAYDAVLLDVDNGAEAFTTAGNAALYRDAGVRAAADALRPGGRLAYWSANADPAFEAVLRRAGLVVEAVRARAHAAGGPWHSIYVARARPAAAPPAAAPPAAQPRNPLHGVTLERMVTELATELGWAGLGRRVPVRCFTHEPSVGSSLNFLRRTPWARAQVEALYAERARRRR